MSWQFVTGHFLTLKLGKSNKYFGIWNGANSILRKKSEGELVVSTKSWYFVSFNGAYL